MIREGWSGTRSASPFSGFRKGIRCSRLSESKRHLNLIESREPDCPKPLSPESFPCQRAIIHPLAKKQCATSKQTKSSTDSMTLILTGWESNFLRLPCGLRSCQLMQHRFHALLNILRSSRWDIAGMIASSEVYITRQSLCTSSSLSRGRLP
jgi:hypothetical protein